VCILQCTKIINKRRDVFDVQVIVNRDKFSIINQDALTPQIYFWNKTLHVSDSSSVHRQEISLYTQ
jgi:hypothetical protein